MDCVHKHGTFIFMVIFSILSTDGDNKTWWNMSYLQPLVQRFYFHTSYYRYELHCYPCILYNQIFFRHLLLMVRKAPMEMLIQILASQICINIHNPWIVTRPFYNAYCRLAYKLSESVAYPIERSMVRNIYSGLMFSHLQNTLCRVQLHTLN